MPPPATGRGRGIVCLGLSVRLSFRLLTAVSWRDISLLTGGISVNLSRNIHHRLDPAEKVLEVRGDTRPINLQGGGCQGSPVHCYVIGCCSSLWSQTQYWMRLRTEIAYKVAVLLWICMQVFISDVTKLVKHCIRRMRISTSKIRRMRMQIPLYESLFYQSECNALVYVS